MLWADLSKPKVDIITMATRGMLIAATPIHETLVIPPDGRDHGGALPCAPKVRGGPHNSGKGTHNELHHCGIQQRKELLCTIPPIMSIRMKHDLYRAKHLCLNTV
jgi:hypothetical protein